MAPLRHGCTVRAAVPSYNLSVSLRSTAPLVGEPLAKPFTLRGLPKPPLGRGGGSASAMTERLSPAAAHGQASLRTTSQSASQTAPLVGEPLAKPFTLRGLPKPPLGRGGGSASALTERLSPAAAHGQASILSFPYKHQQKEPQHPVTGTAALVYFSSRSWLTSPCLRLQQRSRQNASPGPRP